MKKYVIGAGVWLMSLSWATAQPSPANLPLDRAVQLALQNNKGIKLADSRTRAAEARAQEAKDRSLPQAAASLAYSRYSLTGPFSLGEGSDGKALLGIPAGAFNATIGGVTLSKEIFGGFAEKSARLSADLLARASQLDARRNRAELVYTVTDAYYNIVKLVRSTSVIEQNIRQFDERERDARNLEKEGIVTANEVLKIQLQKNNLQLSRLQVDKARQTALYNFNLLLGLPDDQAVIIDTTLSNPVTTLEPLAGFLTRAGQARPEVQANILRVQAADAQVRNVKSSLYPHLGVSAGYNYINPTTRVIPEASTYVSAWNVGAGLTYNIGSLYNLKGRLNGAKTAAEEASLQGQQQTDQIRSEVVTAYNTYQLALEQQSVIRTAVGQAQENYRLTESRFRNGLVGSTDLLEANSFLLQAQLNVINATVDAQLAYQRLLKATGNNLN
ncbi:TolC family protein [Spirosoma utsteinense]|uniref:Outer membrane protein TolC n=1 Tax=Spirosoma utsteinense TaxID=2585773 RepID=A0ABR6WC42_9BACT|nr:TolC family protein [Spirosoma utsteinense]MBC3788736.1 outer membrane protein TolC [Spirosoma utsteinense]MBC3794144.1 outer membrane protein TolC [Spirosoma utsteinense]